MGRKTYPPELRAIVTAEAALGALPSELSKKYGVPCKTIDNWKQTLKKASIITRPVAEASLDRISLLLVKYFETAFDSLIKQAAEAGDAGKLKESPLESIAAIHPELWDAVFRILAGFGEAKVQPRLGSEGDTGVVDAEVVETVADTS